MVISHLFSNLHWKVLLFLFCQLTARLQLRKYLIKLETKLHNALREGFKTKKFIEISTLTMMAEIFTIENDLKVHKKPKKKCPLKEIGR